MSRAALTFVFTGLIGLSVAASAMAQNEYPPYANQRYYQPPNTNSPPQPSAYQTRQNNFQTWLQAFASDAIVAGVSPGTVQNALSQVTFDERVIDHDHNQPETTQTFATYSARIVTPDRVAEGRELMHKHARVLHDISKRYGVPPEVIVALWGMESHFGRNSGDYNIVNSLVTLAYEGRRADFFRKEAIAALRILDEEHMQSSELRGSWAGAMGQCQFMPSTYLRYAVDYDGQGRRDIWNNEADVFASIANYLAAEGWRSDLTWGREVSLKKAMPESEIGLTNRHDLAQWKKLGIHYANGGALSIKPLQASLVQPDGLDGRSFLVYDNFRALMRWNKSTYFAASVGLLADKIKSAK